MSELFPSKVYAFLFMQECIALHKIGVWVSIVLFLLKGGYS